MTVDLRKLQSDLRSAADSLEPLIELASKPMGELLASVTPGAGRISDEGKRRIAEANQKLWVECARPECKGVRHRRTHPHIKKAKKTA